jgi:folate-binding protein YgfZ
MLNTYIRKIGVIDAVGKDRMDFFNRMSSNDLTNFSVNTFRKTIFTNDKGRIVDFVTLLNMENKTLILSSPEHIDTLIAHLDKYIIMDDVQLDKPQEDFYMLSIFGNESLINEVSKTGFEVKKDKSVTTDDNFYSFYDDYRTSSVVFVSSNEQLDEIKKSIPDLNELSDDDFKVYRINNGIAEADNEINEQINPVECGLNEYISYTKGCYIGQEVISRLDSQGKVPKQMVKIISANGIIKGEKIFTEDSKEVGFISSTSKADDDSIGLGFIRSVNLDYEKEYFVKNGDKQTKIKISKVI